jgi:hypothetical protein
MFVKAFAALLAVGQKLHDLCIPNFSSLRTPTLKR